MISEGTSVVGFKLFLDFFFFLIIKESTMGIIFSFMCVEVGYLVNLIP